MTFWEFLGAILGSAGLFASILGAFLTYAARKNGEATRELIRSMEERMDRRQAETRELLERMDGRLETQQAFLERMDQRLERQQALLERMDQRLERQQALLERIADRQDDILTAVRQTRP